MGNKGHPYVKIFGAVVFAIILGGAALVYFTGGKLPAFSGYQSSADLQATCQQSGGTWNAVSQMCTIPQNNNPNSGFTCTSPSYTVFAKDAYTQSALTESHNLILDASNSPLTTFTQGTAITSLTPAKSYTFVPGIDTTSFTANAFGTRFSESSLPGCGSHTLQMIQDSLSTDVTNTSLNQYNQPISTTSSTNWIGAQTGVKTLTVGLELTAKSQTSYGNALLYMDSSNSDIGSGSSSHRVMYPNCACLTANSTWLDTSKPLTSYIVSNTPSYTQLSSLGGTLAGQIFGGAMHVTSNPLILSQTTGKVSVCFESEVPNDVKYDQYFSFTTKATIAQFDNFTITEYPANVFKDSYGVIRWDCSTDSGAAVGAANAVVNTYNV